VNILKEIMPDAAFFVVRSKSNVPLRGRYSNPVERGTGVSNGMTPRLASA